MSARLVVLSLEPWDDVWRRNQYLIDGLLRQDASLDVLFVEPAADPVFELARRRRPRRGRGLRAATGYDGRLRLFQPTKLLPRLAGPLADAMLRSAVRRVIDRLGWDRGVLWINDLGWSGLVRSMVWPSLYDMTDDWVQAERGTREHERLREADAELLRLCDVVIVCSPRLEQTKGASREVRLIPNAVDVERYRRPMSRPVDLPQVPVALYVGTLHEDRLDVDLVLSAATAVAEAGGVLAFLGPIALSADNSRRLSGHPHVALLGPRGHDEVPAYLQHAHVVIVPHVVNDFTESLDPLKLYEYAAVGRPIVSTPVAGFRDEPSATIVDRESFPSAVTGALAEWIPTSRGSEVPTWSDRVAEVRSLIEALARSPRSTTP